MIAERKEGFSQVCIWPAMLLKDSEIEELEQSFKDKLGTRVQFLEQYKTNPTPNDTTGETGGRNDIVFAVHQDDVMKFAVQRLSMGIRWVEDVLNNAEERNESEIYPSHLKEYRTW